MKAFKKIVCMMLVMLMSCAVNAYAVTNVGENIVLIDEVVIPSVPTEMIVSYSASRMSWDPMVIDPNQCGIDASCEVRIDSYGGHSYIWKNDSAELFVSDYGYAGFYTDEGYAVSEIIGWYGNDLQMNLQEDDLDFAAPLDAVAQAEEFLKEFNINSVESIKIEMLKGSDAKKLLAAMRREGYSEEIPSEVSDTYIITFAIKIDELPCDTEFFMMANQRDIEGVSITVMVNANGVQYFDCSSAIYSVEEPIEQAPILSYEDMLGVLADKFDDLILPAPIEIHKVKLQYVLLPISNEKSAYIPCWCFATPRGSSGRFVWYRFNAYTGEEII